MTIRPTSLLKTRRFWPIFWVQFLGAMNDNIFRNALVILITFSFANSVGWDESTAVAAAGGLFILPFFLFSALAGQIADRYPKHKVVQYTKFAEIILAVMISYGLWVEAPYALLFVLFLMGTQSTFFGPIKYGILPEHLKKKELILGNALVEAATYIAILLGTVIGGVIILRAGGVLTISAIVICVAIVGWLISWHIPVSVGAKPDLDISPNIFGETYRLIQHSMKKHVIFQTILGISWFWFVGSIWLTILPPYVKDHLGGDESIVTFFITLFAVGIGAGSLFCNKLLDGEISAKHVPLGGLGITIITWIFIQTSWCVSGPFDSFLSFFSLSGLIIVSCIIGIGFCGGIFSVPLYALLQARSQRDYRARNIAATNILNALFMVGAALLAMGIYAIGGGIFMLLAITGIINLVVCFYVIKLVPESIIHTALRWVIQRFYRVKVSGLENLNKANRRSIIIANHTSLLDPLFLTAFIPQRLYFAIDTNIAKKWWMRLVLWAVRVYPLDPTKPMAIKSLVGLVKKGRKVVIFPEGRITVTGALMKIYEGPGMVADKAQADIIPVQLDGLQFTPFSYLKGKVRTHLFPKVSIDISEPTTLRSNSELKGRDARKAMSRQLYDVMTNMIVTTAPTSQTIFQSLIDAAKLHHLDEEVIQDMKFKPLTYRQLIGRSWAVGKAITAGTEPGEAVGLMIPNSNAAAVAYFGTLSRNRVPAMLNYSAGKASILAACQTVKLKQVWTSEEFVRVAKLEDTINVLRANGITVHFLEELKQQRRRVLWRALVASWIPELLYKWQKSDREGADPATILFTSGSSGVPKAVVLSHENLNMNRYQMTSVIDFNSKDKLFNAMPIFHAFGLMGGVLVPILSGVPVFMYPTPLHYGVIPEIIYDVNATIFFGTNTFLKGYARRANPYDFYSIRYIVSGAEKVQDDVRKTYSNVFGLRILEGYGTTETSPGLCINTPMYNKIGSVGRFLPGIEYRLEDVPGLVEGKQLWVKGKNIMLGYMLHDNPGELVPPAEGWHDTGDIVTVDSQGFVTIVGRAKRFAKIGGELVSLTAVEELASEVWPGVMHACLSRVHAQKGEELVLITEKEDADWKELRTYARKQGMGELFIPRIVRPIKRIALLGSGKPDYVTLDEQLKAGEI